MSELSLTNVFSQFQKYLRQKGAGFGREYLSYMKNLKK